MVHKKLVTYLIITTLCSYQSSWSTFDCFPYFDNDIIVAVPPLSLKHIALYALSNGLKSIFQPKTAVYTLGFVGCLMSGKLLYSAIAKNDKDMNRKKNPETAIAVDKKLQIDPTKKFPDYSYTQSPG